VQCADAFSNPETTIILIHVIIIHRSSPLDIDDENSYNKAEKTLKSLENQIRKIHPSTFGEIIQARHAGAAILEMVKVNKPRLLILGANKKENGKFDIGKNAKFVLKNNICPTILYKDQSL
tara:strand:- start:392 stop:754 length:363 start_codon:yes stop_codon:yes gene_type:complete